MVVVWSSEGKFRGFLFYLFILFINAREKQIDFTDDCLKGAVKLKWLKIEHTFYMKYVI